MVLSHINIVYRQYFIYRYIITITIRHHALPYVYTCTVSYCIWSMETFNPLNTFVYHVLLCYIINGYLIQRKYIDTRVITAILYYEFILSINISTTYHNTAVGFDIWVGDSWILIVVMRFAIFVQFFNLKFDELRENN